MGIIFFSLLSLSGLALYLGKNQKRKVSKIQFEDEIYNSESIFELLESLKELGESKLVALDLLNEFKKLLNEIINQPELSINNKKMFVVRNDHLEYLAIFGYSEIGYKKKTNEFDDQLEIYKHLGFMRKLVEILINHKSQEINRDLEQLLNFASIQYYKLKKIIMIYGNDYNVYSSDQKDMIEDCVNTMNDLEELVNKNILIEINSILNMVKEKEPQIMNEEKIEIHEYVKTQLTLISRNFFELHIDDESRIINENGEDIGRLKDNTKMSIHNILKCSFINKKAIINELTNYLIDGLYGIKQSALDKYILNLEYISAVTDALYFSNPYQIVCDFMKLDEFGNLESLLDLSGKEVN